MASAYLKWQDDVQTARVYQAALLGIVVWDWLVSLRSEYRHVWKGGATLHKILYVIARYVCLVLTVLVFAIQFVNLPLAQCHAFIRANCMALTIVQVTSISVLTHRVWAVYTNRKARYWVIGSLLTLDLATFIFGMVHAAVAVAASSDPMVDGKGFCQIRVHSHWEGFTAVFFAVPILAHTMATAAVAWAVDPLPNTNAVKRLLLVDGVLYMLAVNTISITQLVFYYQTSSDSLKMLNSAALLSLTAVFCCRFMLHLREQAEEINRFPFGRSPNTSGLSKFGAGNEKTSKTSLFKRHSKPAVSASGSMGSGAGTVTVHSEPDTLVELTPRTAVNPLEFVTVQHLVEHRVENMTPKEKEYTSDFRKGRKSYDEESLSGDEK